MSVKIISRAEWGAKPWDNDPRSSGPAAVPLSSRTEWFVHYDGATPITRTGYAIPRAIEAEHLANGWAGIGYSFVVDQAGNAYEGRGWGRQGAHCPGHNVSGLSVQIAVGGDQEPTPAALATARALYDEACQRTGRTLAPKGHRDGIATLCPGARLYAWVKAGMPAQGYNPAPNPGGSLPGRGAEVARYQVVINGLTYGYGAVGDHVTKVGEFLVARGFGRHYTSGPGPVWTDADTLNYADYQRSLGYSGKDADGVPGETSLKQLLGTLPAAAAKTTTPPPFPGRRHFQPGQSNRYVTQLGQQLVKKGYGRFYTQGPGPKWTENDRKNTEAFQRAQGWTSSDADGYPGPETWRRLFS
ncbi:peptidoglycan-binding protein [Streptomyces sp. NPDC014889]|uniref:peptidoglycan-binding protein n=1 Tax=Streptomyces sp. NPDC014889 TaxID=3364928 RepID=UPI0036F72119